METKEQKSKGIQFTILAIVLIIIFSVSVTQVTLQNDTYYTIKIGEHINKYGIDMKDPFSWHEDLSYTYPHWGYDLITYYIYNAFGMTGIYITTCILSSILGISIYLTNSKLVKNKILSFIITIGAMYLIRGYIAARAQLVTFILFVLTILFIEKFIETRKKRYALGLIVIPIIIANIHVAVFPFYFVLYLPYVAEYIIAILGEIIIYRKVQLRILKDKIYTLKKKSGKEEKIKELEIEQLELEEKIKRIKAKREQELQNPYKIKLEKKDNVKWLIIIMIICIFTGFLTPLGTTPYTYLIKTMEGNTTQNINEHLPMTLANETNIMCTLVIFLSFLVFTKTKIRLCDLFMIGGLFYLMIASRRQVTMFVLIGSVILNRIIQTLMDMYKQNNIPKKRNILEKLIASVVLIAAIIGLSYYTARFKFNDKFIDDTSYPVEACNYIIENIDLGKARFYNEYNYGSYMLFRGIPVFIDSRADLYSPEFSGKTDQDIFSDFIDTSSIGKYYEDIFEKYNITHVISYKDSKMNMIITKSKDENYKELYSDKYFVVYERLNNK